MVRTESPICDFNLPAVDFKLKGVDGKYYDLNSLKGPNGLLIMFICNHCPYVKSIIKRIIRDTSELKKLGVNSVGIMSNDPNEYEDTSQRVNYDDKHDLKEVTTDEEEFREWEGIEEDWQEFNRKGDGTTKKGK